LSLILALLFSFLLTTLEAARMQGAKAYLSMVSNLAGDSFLASYYYPLFQDYRLFSVNCGDIKGRFSAVDYLDEMQKNVGLGMEDISWGLLQFQNTSVGMLDYSTLLSDGEGEFLSQVRQQMVFEGLTLPLQELFPEKEIKEAAMAGEIYREQETALEATTAVAAEVLKLMELADGICVTKNGIVFDNTGKVKTKESFIKQMIPLGKREIKKLYENEEVFQAVSESFFRAEDMAEKIKGYLEEAKEYGQLISSCETRITNYERKIAELTEEQKKLSSQEKGGEDAKKEIREKIKEAEKAKKDAAKKKKTYEKKRSDILSEAKKEYNELKKKMQNIQEKTEEALQVTDQLEKKQEEAQITVKAYETFLEGTKEEISEELFRTFSVELEEMKCYVGLEESGIYVERIRENLTQNRDLLSDLALQGFSADNLKKAEEETENIINRMQEYRLDALWFPYGELVVKEGNAEDITGELNSLLSQGLFSLVGIDESAISQNRLDGEDLPSKEWEEERKSGELAESVTEVLELLQNGEIDIILKEVQTILSDKTALELYSRKYFRCYGEEATSTRLEYEREYLIFGEMEDKENLKNMILYLLALRILFCMVMILKQPDRMAELDSFANGVAGLTGIPALATAVKYSILLLWSVEEALVEVAGLMKGKPLPFTGNGTVEFYEVFLLNKEMIAKKADSLPDGGGISYSGYLTFLSLLKGTPVKAYRAMDIIQENMRLRYNDGFRMENQVTALFYYTKTKLKPLFDTGVFPSENYETEYQKEVCFGACS